MNKTVENFKAAINALPKGKGGRPNGNACYPLLRAALAECPEASSELHDALHFIRWVQPKLSMKKDAK